MWQYIKNIIPRIQQFSDQLSNVEVFVDKPWILIDEDENTHEYVFLRDKRLILSVNGKVIQGNWELLPTGKLLINRVTDQVLLEHAYIDEGILLLKISSGKDLPFMLINEKVIPDRDPVRYLQKVEAKKLNYEYYNTEEGITLNNNNSSTGKFEIGAIITYDNGNKVNGEIQSASDKEKFAILHDGVIQKKYYLMEYISKYNKVIKVRQKSNTIIQLGDSILNHRDLYTNIHKNALKYSDYDLIITDNNGIVTKVRLKHETIGIIIIVCIIIVIIYLIVGMISSLGK